MRLVDIHAPQPRAGQALVRVTSAGVTPLDRTVLAGLHPLERAPDALRHLIEDRPFGTGTLTVST